MPSSVRMVQLSDTHFIESGATPQYGHAYDTDASFAAVLVDLGDHDHLDLVVVTGDVADHGRAEQYRKAGAAFSQFQVPVNVCPGNHDLDMAFRAGIGRSGVHTTRVIEVNNWAFLFVDSCAGIMVNDESGLLVDPPDNARLHNDGALASSEAAWIRSMCSTTTAEHVFIWLHHPPAVPLELNGDGTPDYDADWRALVPNLSKVRGLGGGHTHVPAEYEFEGLPVWVAPSLKSYFDRSTKTWVAPGYRTFAFGVDGSIRSDVHFVLTDEAQ